MNFYNNIRFPIYDLLKIALMLCKKSKKKWTINDNVVLWCFVQIVRLKNSVFCSSRLLISFELWGTFHVFHKSFGYFTALESLNSLDSNHILVPSKKYSVLLLTQSSECTPLPDLQPENFKNNIQCSRKKWPLNLFLSPPIYL